MTPSLTFILDINPKIGLKRSKRKSNTETRYENMSLTFHNKIRKEFINIAKSNKKKFILIDANQNINQIQNIIWNEISNKINAK